MSLGNLSATLHPHLRRIDDAEQSLTRYILVGWEFYKLLSAMIFKFFIFNVMTTFPTLNSVRYFARCVRKYVYKSYKRGIDTIALCIIYYF
jgi:hypothetical protein